MNTLTKIQALDPDVFGPHSAALADLIRLRTEKNNFNYIIDFKIDEAAKRVRELNESPTGGFRL